MTQQQKNCQSREAQPSPGLHAITRETMERAQAFQGYIPALTIEEHACTVIRLPKDFYAPAPQTPDANTPEVSPEPGSDQLLG